MACSSLSLIPFLLAAAHALKLGARGETYDRVSRTDRPCSAAELVILVVAVVGCVAGIVAPATGAITI